MKILEIDGAVDAMNFLEYFPEEDLAAAVENGLKSENVYERLVSAEIVDVSINGINEEILGDITRDTIGDTEDFFDFVKRVQREFLIDLRMDAYRTIKSIKGEEIDSNLLEKIERRLQC